MLGTIVFSLMINDIKPVSSSSLFLLIKYADGFRVRVRVSIPSAFLFVLKIAT